MSADGASRRLAPGIPLEIAADSTAEPLGVEQTYITVCASGGALTMRFGDMNVADAETTDWPLQDGEKESFYIGYSQSYVSIQGAGSLLVVVG